MNLRFKHKILDMFKSVCLKLTWTKCLQPQKINTLVLIYEILGCDRFIGKGYFLRFQTDLDDFRRFRRSFRQTFV